MWLRQGLVERSTSALARQATEQPGARPADRVRGSSSNGLPVRARGTTEGQPTRRIRWRRGPVTSKEEYWPCIVRAVRMRDQEGRRCLKDEEWRRGLGECGAGRGEARASVLRGSQPAELLSSTLFRLTPAPSHHTRYSPATTAKLSCNPSLITSVARRRLLPTRSPDRTAQSAHVSGFGSDRPTPPVPLPALRLTPSRPTTSPPCQT